MVSLPTSHRPAVDISRSPVLLSASRVVDPPDINVLKLINAQEALPTPIAGPASPCPQPLLVRPVLLQDIFTVARLKLKCREWKLVVRPACIRVFSVAIGILVEGALKVWTLLRWRQLPRLPLPTNRWTHCILGVLIRRTSVSRVPRLPKLLLGIIRIAP